VEARIFSTRWYGASGFTFSAQWITSVLGPPHSTLDPRATRTSDIQSTSAIRGTLCTTYSPGASTVAAISFNTEFFAPEMEISPWRGCPERMTISFISPVCSPGQRPTTTGADHHAENPQTPLL
jgi:hypothetical protein